MSKGSTPRPMDIPKERFDEAFEKIFGKKKPEPQKDQQNVPNT